MPEVDVYGTRDGEPGLGYGLNGIADWDTSQPFLDVFKTSRAWLGHEPFQWGGLEFEEMQAMGIIDANGYPTEMPDGLERIETLVLTQMPAEAVHSAGRYRLQYEGEGEIEIRFGASNVSYDDGEIWFDYEPNGENMVAISILSTDPRENGEYLRNFTLVHQDNIPLFDAGEIFNPLWVDVIDEAHAVRFMDWMQTNDSKVETWEDRPQVENATWAAGVPLEIMVELANQTGIDPWFNIPHNADDTYIRNFAEYVQQNLSPDLRAHFEFSNEVWNWQFEQAQDSMNDGLDRFGQSHGDGWVQEYAARSTEMALILDEVFTLQEDRLVKVISTQTGWIGLEESILNAPAYVALDPNNEAPYTHFDTYAVTGYFSGALGNEKAPDVLNWISQSIDQATMSADLMGLSGAEREQWVQEHKYDLATSYAIQEIRDGSVTGNPMGSLVELRGMFDYHAQVAATYGLDLVMYEGGTHVVATGSWTGNQELSEFFIHLNYAPEMEGLYDELLEHWVDAGGTLFNAFVEVSAPSQWGSWGSLRYLGDETGRNNALEEFLDAYPRPESNIGNPPLEPEVDWGNPDTDFADADLYDVGVIGTDEEDRVTTGDLNEFIVTGAGNDLIYGSDGADRHDGGEGLGDRVQYLDPTGIVIDMNDPTQGTGSAFGDSFVNIERIQGGEGDDTIRLAAGATGYGKGGNDTVVDSFGREIMRGGAGADTFVLSGRDGEADIIRDYEAGVDTMDLSGWGVAWEDIKITGRDDGRAFLTVDGDVLIINGGWDPETGTHLLDKDDFILLPSDGPDVLLDPRTDWLDPAIYDVQKIGSPADDRLDADSRNEFNLGGEGNDLFFGSAGMDHFDGGAGLGDRVQYHDIEGIIIDMNDPTAGTGSAYGDSFNGIERIQGGGGGDTIRLAVGATGYGKGGADTIVDGSGREIMRGDSGADTFRFLTRDGEADIIKDYEAGTDIVDLAGWNASWDDLEITGEQNGRVHISVDGDSLIVEGAWDAQTGTHLLNQDDFIF